MGRRDGRRTEFSDWQRIRRLEEDVDTLEEQLERVEALVNGAQLKLVGALGAMTVSAIGFAYTALSGKF